MKYFITLLSLVFFSCNDKIEKNTEFTEKTEKIYLGSLHKQYKYFFSEDTTQVYTLSYQEVDTSYDLYDFSGNLIDENYFKNKKDSILIPNSGSIYFYTNVKPKSGSVFSVMSKDSLVLLMKKESIPIIFE